jgi:hypothetical protein
VSLTDVTTPCLLLVLSIVGSNPVGILAAASSRRRRESDIGECETDPVAGIAEVLVYFLFHRQVDAGRNRLKLGLDWDPARAVR